jgi:spermidine synthase
MGSTLPVPKTPGSKPNQTLALFLISVVGLFLELLLIRWIGTEVRLFAYLQNTVLVVCFLGLGLGCLTCRKPVALRDILIPLFVLTALLAIPISRIALGKTSELLSVFDDMVIWYTGSTGSIGTNILYVILGLGLAFLLMALICDIFIPIGRILGRLIDDHPRPIWAYSVNVAGSLIGIWLFVSLSVFHLPPLVWFAVAVALLLYFLDGSTMVRRINLGLLAAILVFGGLAGWEFGSLQTLWSPYQKLAVERTGTDRPRSTGWTTLLSRETVSINGESLGEYALRVNNVGYQWMFDLVPEHMAQEPDRYPAEMKGHTQYDLPSLLHPKARKMLIVGAGSGNDVAGGLRHKIPEIVAVEIDPVIIELGRAYHPEKPYDSPAVRVVNDDARSFFATTTERFDLIVFGLLDSHTTTALTNARLDHYVYTRESIQKARELLADDGVMVLSFAASHEFISDRMGKAVREVFPEQPLAYRVPANNCGTGGIFFVAGDLSAVRERIKAQPHLAKLLDEWKVDWETKLPGATRVATDDWPYIYLPSARIPVLYYLLGGVLLLLFWRSVRRVATPGLMAGWSRLHWHFFFLGAAFLLLETQNISKASVILGNTWLVNAVIISGILVMILLANGLAAAFPRLPLLLVYLLLIGSCLGLYFVNLAQFASLPYLSKVLVVGGLTSLPMLFSGIVFIRSFAATAHKEAALGANLFGALAGGVLQSITYVIGIQALLFLVAALYLVAVLTRPARAAGTVSPQQTSAGTGKSARAVSEAVPTGS